MNLPFSHRPSFEEDMLRRLRELPVQPASPGFAASMTRERRMAEWRFGVGLALAASLTVAVGIGTWLGVRDGMSRAAEPTLVMLAPGEVQQVGLMFRSEHALPGVTIHLQIPEGVELAGYPGRSALHWTADLQAGANRLNLPVIVRRGASGVLVASLMYGQDRRQISVLVKAREPSGIRGGA